MNALNFDPKINKTSFGQLATTAVAAIIVSAIGGGISFSAIIFAVGCSYLLKGVLAPAAGFWQDFPSKMSLSVLFMILLLAGFGVPHMSWLFVVGLATVLGLGLGRQAMKLLTPAS
jgi:hypothetical protein